MAAAEKEEIPENIKLYWIRGLSGVQQSPNILFAGYFAWQETPNHITGKLVDVFGLSEIFGGTCDEIFGLRLIIRSGENTSKYSFHTKEIGGGGVIEGRWTGQYQSGLGKSGHAECEISLIEKEVSGFVLEDLFTI